MYGFEGCAESLVVSCYDWAYGIGMVGFGEVCTRFLRRLYF